MNKIFDGTREFLKFLLVYFSKIATNLWEAKDGIPLNQLVADSLQTLFSAGMMIVFNVVAFIVFIFLPQGKDILLIVSEDISQVHFGSFIWLLAGTVIWSIFSEFAVRYAIYVSDNSGNSLSFERVRWRRALQDAIADCFLIIPYIIVLLGMFLNRQWDDLDTMLTLPQKNLGFWIPIAAIYLTLSIVAHLYFDKIKNRKPGWWSPWIAPELERTWCNKLTGIYNDYVFFLPKNTNFSGKAKEDMIEFERNFGDLEPGKRNGFPQSELMADKSRIPAEFQLRKYSEDFSVKPVNDQKDQSFLVEPNENGRYRWKYRIPNSFYSVLHKKLYAIISVSIGLFLSILFLGINYYAIIGAPGLLVLSFASWIGLYLAVLHVDYALFRRGAPVVPGMPISDEPGKYQEPVYKRGDRWKGRLSLRALVFVMLILSSFTNSDHPLRYGHGLCYGNTTAPADKRRLYDSRPSMKEHFKEWLKNYATDTSIAPYFRVHAPDTAIYYPVVFVCAEGGALRTGAYTSIMLGLLQDSLKKQHVDFARTVYAYSGVSGGSLGISFFNTLAYFGDRRKPDNYSYREKSIQYFETDYLAPVIGKMFYGDILNLILPFRVARFDRAIALEEIWEAGYDRINPTNYFADDYLGTYHNLDMKSGIGSYPAMFVNTTEVESGLQCWLTNVRPDTPMYFAADRDLLLEKIKGGISYSTMINFSTRFPLLSPAACVPQSSVSKLHYVDGGYVENTGQATMTEIIRCLEYYSVTCFDGRCVHFRPYVISLRFGEEPEEHQQINFGNELSEICFGLYNTRAGRVKMADGDLKTLVRGLGGELISLPLAQDGKKVPMNWVLSKQSIRNLDSCVRDTWKNRAKNQLSTLPFIRPMQQEAISGDGA